jgi:hypothetical protein
MSNMGEVRMKTCPIRKSIFTVTVYNHVRAA